MKRIALALALLAVASAQKGIVAVNNQPNRPSSISMIMLGVENMKRSVAFYRDTVGLELQSESEEFAFFKTGSVTLALNANLGKIEPRAGAVEIIFPVESVKRAHDLLAEKGLGFLHKPRQVNATSFTATFRDPDGHLLTLYGAE